MALPQSADDVSPPPGAVASRALTWVALVWEAGRTEYWIRFGSVRDERILDRRRREVAFAAGDLFAFVRWCANDRGTVQSRIDVVRAVEGAGQACRLPGLAPGGELLLHIAGWPRVQRALAAIDQVEQIGVDAAHAAPDHWRHVNNRLSARGEPEPYTLARHRAWLRRAALFA